MIHALTSEWFQRVTRKNECIVTVRYDVAVTSSHDDTLVGALKLY
jgi:hypothetical protein